jgi:hypothetical protein
MSLGGGYSKAVNNGVAAAVRAGLTVCVAAGNESVSLSFSPLSTNPFTRPLIFHPQRAYFGAERCFNLFSRVRADCNYRRFHHY